MAAPAVYDATFRLDTVRELFVALFAFNGLAALVNLDFLIGAVIAEGLVIAGWVLLWFPLDELTSTQDHERTHRAIYDRLMEIGLTIRAAPTTGRPAPSCG